MHGVLFAALLGFFFPVWTKYNFKKIITRVCMVWVCVFFFLSVWTESYIFSLNIFLEAATLFWLKYLKKKKKTKTDPKADTRLGKFNLNL